MTRVESGVLPQVGCCCSRWAAAMELSAEYLREKLQRDLEAEHVVSGAPWTRPARGKGLLGGRFAPPIRFCPIGSGGHDSEPLCVQLPSPGGVGQVRGEAAASETPVRPGEHLARRGPSSGTATPAAAHNPTPSPPPVRPSTVDYDPKDSPSRPLYGVLRLRLSISIVPRTWKHLQPPGST